MDIEKVGELMEAAMKADVAAAKERRNQPKYIDKNCLSYWFPKLERAGILVPKTTIIRTDLDLVTMLDNKYDSAFDRAYAALVAQVKEEADKFGYPCFLRSGLFSGKHRWEETCYVKDGANIGYQIYNIVEFSHLVDFMGLATDVWVVREFLPLEVLFTLPRYENMPLAREMRMFIKDGKIQCFHDYWPWKAIEEGRPPDPDWKEKVMVFHRMDSIMDDAKTVVQQVAEVFNGDGAWSVDVCRHQDGQWFVTDMAIAEQSFHWESCPFAPVRRSYEDMIAKDAIDDLMEAE